MATNAFCLSLAPAPAGNYRALELPSFTGPEDANSYAAPLAIKLAWGDKLEYGALFAYLFRRFGYPNHRWDGFKELACYLLTTPKPDLLLCVKPNVAGAPDLHFSFLVPAAIATEHRNYARRAYLAWQGRMCDWLETQDRLPDWLPGAMDFINSDRPTPLTWRQGFEQLAVIHRIDEHQRPVGVGRAWQLEVEAAYAAIEPKPDCPDRSYDWRTWPDEDPAKAYVQAAYEALLDLRRPVAVRDAYITASGPAHEPVGCGAVVGPAAGFAAGQLANLDPAGIQRLHQAVQGLAAQLNGDLQQALALAVAQLEKMTAPGQPGGGADND